jgi:hypothetical protein
MMDQGLICILPGIQGVDYHYQDIRKGLQGSGIQCAIMIRPWGSQIPGIKLVVNETDVPANRAWGDTLAREIQAYQRQYPGRPVHLIGQSGGGAICVFAVESLAKALVPVHRPVDPRPKPAVMGRFAKAECKELPVTDDGGPTSPAHAAPRRRAVGLSSRREDRAGPR